MIEIVQRDSGVIRPFFAHILNAKLSEMDQIKLMGTTREVLTNQIIFKIGSPSQKFCGNKHKKEKKYSRLIIQFTEVGYKKDFFHVSIWNPIRTTSHAYIITCQTDNFLFLMSIKICITHLITNQISIDIHEIIEYSHEIYILAGRQGPLRNQCVYVIYTTRYHVIVQRVSIQTQSTLEYRFRVPHQRKKQVHAVSAYSREDRGNLVLT